MEKDQIRSTGSMSLVQKLRRQVENSLKNEQFNGDQLAAEMNMSRLQLNRELKKSTGQSANQFIREYRLQRALDLLKQGEKTVSEIAFEVGFGSQSYFTTCFTEHYGYHPDEVKNKLLKGFDSSAVRSEEPRPEPTRQLAAIMFTDIAGYTAMMQENEQKAIQSIKFHRSTIEKCVQEHGGELIQYYGDGSLSIFNSAVSAVDCAVQIQKIADFGKSLPLRIGIHIGDLIIEEKNVFGDGVNVASRIESIGITGSVLLSQNVFEKIRNIERFHTKSIGEYEFKNVDQAIEVYAISNQGFQIPKSGEVSGKLSPKTEAQGDVPLGSITDLKISDKSIAVLPFANMSNDPDQDFFCKGISEEIINTIVQLPDLKVVGRTSSFRFQGISDDLRAIGNSLGVSKILEGSVRKSGENIRITAQLIEVSTGFYHWSTKYDRKLDNVFEIQDEISAEIAKQLKITFEGADSKPKPRQQTKNIEAYERYFKGRTLYYQRGTALFEALKCFKAALEVDPTYALASSGLADNYIMLSFHGYLSPSVCWKGALPAARKANKFGPDLGETHNTLAVIALLYDRKIEPAQREFEKALEINPTNTQARVWYGLFCLTFALQKTQDGIKQLEIAIENDPLSSYAHACYSLTLCTDNQLEKAIVSAKYAVELDPKNWIARYCLGHCYLWGGKASKALGEIQLSLEMSNRHSWSLHLIALIYLKLNKRKETLKIFQEMQNRYQENYFPPSCLAIVAAALGRDDYALELAHEAVDIFDPYLQYISTIFKDSEQLRNISGYDQILERLGYLNN